LTDERIFIKGVTYDGTGSIIPVFNTMEADPAYISKMVFEYKYLFPIPEEWLNAFDPQIYTFDTNEDDSDYLYNFNKMGNFKGKHLHGQKNHLLRFLDIYARRGLPLTPDILPDAVKIFESWQAVSNNEAVNNDYIYNDFI